MKVPASMYRDFFEEVVELARKRGYTGLQVRVGWGNNPTHQLSWTTPIEETCKVEEVRPS